jgi:hypothetical protein
MALPWPASSALAWPLASFTGCRHEDDLDQTQAIDTLPDPWRVPIQDVASLPKRMPKMSLKDLTTADLPDLEAQLQHALDSARNMELLPHTVRNCPSDLQGRDQAWRKVQNLQYIINCIKNDRPIY